MYLWSLSPRSVWLITWRSFERVHYGHCCHPTDPPVQKTRDPSYTSYFYRKRHHPLVVRWSIVYEHNNHGRYPTCLVMGSKVHRTHPPTNNKTSVVHPTRVGVRGPSLHVYGRYHLPRPVKSPGPYRTKP